MNDITKSIYDEVVGEVLLQIRTNKLRPCTYYSPFGLCRTLECLYCENCDFMITYPNSEAIATNDNLRKEMQHVTDDDFEILFYDRLPDIDELYSYLFSDDSQFRIVRLSDSEVMVDHVNKHKQKQLVK